MTEFQNSISFVTGAGQGIGRTIAVALLKAGSRVALIGRSAGKLVDVADQAGVPTDQVLQLPLDITDRNAVGNAVEETVAAFGRIDHLVNSAGILEQSDLLTAPIEAVRQVIEVNMISTISVTQVVARQMMAQGSGSIVTIGSNSGTTPRLGIGAYAASKAGVEHAMKCIGLSLAEHGIRSNIVSPGSTDTPMQRSFQTDTSTRDKVINGDMDIFRLGIPLRRMADPEDVADAVLFLLSDKARHITMENLVIDGGATLGAR